MKKILTLVALLGFGLMVGCGEETPKKTTGTTSASPSGTNSMTHTTTGAAPSGTH